MSGFSLIEFLIALGIGAVAVAGMFAIYVSSGKTSDLVTASITKSGLFNNLNSAVRSPTALLSSDAAALNAGSLFVTCRAGGACAAPAPAGTGFYLYDQGPSGGAIIAGPASANIYFDSRGRSCTTHSSTCIFQAITVLETICSGSLTVCANAARVKYSYQISPILPLRGDEVLNFKTLKGSFTSSIGAGSGGTPLGLASYVPVWDASGNLVPSTIRSDLVTGKTFFLQGLLNQTFTVTRNTTFGGALLPGNLNVQGDSAFDQGVTMAEAGAGSAVNFNQIAGYDHSLASFMTANNLRIEAPPLNINANLWTGKLKILSSLDCQNSASAPGFIQTSDERLKTKIKDISDAEGLIAKLQPVSFRWLDSGELDMGFVAQDVEKIFPELVTHDKRGAKEVEYLNLLAPLVSAMNTRMVHQHTESLRVDRKLTVLENDILR